MVIMLVCWVYCVYGGLFGFWVVWCCDFDSIDMLIVLYIVGFGGLRLWWVLCFCVLVCGWLFYAVCGFVLLEWFFL